MIKEIENFLGYGVDELGNIYSRRKRKPLQKDNGTIYGQTTILTNEWVKLSTKCTTHGYVYVTLCKNGKVYSKRLHKLVAEAFIANPHGHFFVCHNNGIKNDNRVENLRWDSPQNNQKDRLIHGTTRLSKWKIDMLRKLYKSGDITLHGVAKLYKLNDNVVKNEILI